jgi:hypothetical protein
LCLPCLSTYLAPYQSPAKKEPKVFARNHQYKLYVRGEFYDVPNDLLEQHPISYDALDENTQKIYQQLESVIKKQGTRRLDAIRRN